MKPSTPDYESIMRKVMTSHEEPLYDGAWAEMSALLDARATSTDGGGDLTSAVPSAAKTSTTHILTWPLLCIVAAVFGWAGYAYEGYLAKAEMHLAPVSVQEVWPEGYKGVTVVQEGEEQGDASPRNIEPEATPMPSPLADGAVAHGRGREAGLVKPQHSPPSTVGHEGASTASSASSPLQRMPEKAVDALQNGPATPPNDLRHPAPTATYPAADAAAPSDGMSQPTPLEPTNSPFDTPSQRHTPPVEEGGPPSDGAIAREQATLLATRPLSPLPINQSEVALEPKSTFSNCKYRRLKRGWVMGANLAVTNYTSLHTSTLPLLGYFVTWPWRGGHLQAELHIKAVHGYGYATDFEYVTPSGIASFQHRLDQLFMLEVPLIYLRPWGSEQRLAWLAGVRPSFNMPRGKSSASYSSSFPSLDITLRKGLQSFDLGFTLGLAYQLNAQWQVDLRATQGLFDLTHDNYFKIQDYVFNSDVQLTFRRAIHPIKCRRERPPAGPLYPNPDGADGL